MFGLFMLIVIYLVLGFLLAWIVGIVAKEEIEIKTGVIILVVTGIIGLGARVLLAQSAPDMVEIAGVGINFVVLTLMTNMFARIGWKNSVIVAAIYTALLFGIGLAIGSMLAS